eukprot:Em0001g3385a
MFGRRAILPIEAEEQCASSSCIEDSESNDLVTAMNKMTDVKKTLYQKAHDNILSAQQRYKRDYDKKHCKGKALDVGSMVLLRKSQRDGRKDGRWVRQTIAYASQSLAPAEKNYSQIEKEGLAVVWGVKKFHQFLFGRQFVVYSNHKPLQFLFNGVQNQGNADGLSRLPLAEAPEEVPTPVDTILMLQAFSDMSSVVTATSIRRWTDKDPVLSVKAIRVLRQVFSCHGLPEVLVSDNGTAFTSTEFQTFVQRNGFRHIRSAPYHPATNGLAERAVQTVKNALRKTSGDIETCLSRFLFQYREVTAVLGPLTLIVTLDDGTETRYHVDHVKEWITGGKRDSETFQQPELDPLPTIVTMADRQAELPQAPAPPIAEVEPDPDPLEEEAPPVADLEAVPLLSRGSTRSHRPPERYG